MCAPAAARSEVNENEYNHGLDELSTDKTFPSSQSGRNLDMSSGNSDK